MDYGGKYLKIRKAVHEAGFDEFFQAGGTNRFHKMFIVCRSDILSRLFWVGIEGGYGVKDEFYIASQDIARTKPEERTTYKTQEEMASAIQGIGKQISAAKAARKGRKA